MTQGRAFVGESVTRLPDWRPRLVVYLDEVRGRTFAYGSHDCALFVAGAVQAMTGQDFAAQYRGRYTTLKEGLNALPPGVRDHVALVAETLEEVAPAFAAVGDLALIEQPGEIAALGIFEGQHIIVLRETGLGLVPREAAARAWRVA